MCVCAFVCMYVRVCVCAYVCMSSFACTRRICQFSSSTVAAPSPPAPASSSLDCFATLLTSHQIGFRDHELTAAVEDATPTHGIFLDLGSGEITLDQQYVVLEEQSLGTKRTIQPLGKLVRVCVCVCVCVCVRVCAFVSVCVCV